MGNYALHSARLYTPTDSGHCYVEALQSAQASVIMRQEIARAL